MASKVTIQFTNDTKKDFDDLVKADKYARENDLKFKRIIKK